MSGYGKSPTTNLNDYNTSRSLSSTADPVEYHASRPIQNTMYLSYAQPGFGDTAVQASSYDQHSDQIPYPAGSFYEPRATYDEVSHPSLTSYGSRKVPEVTSYAPHRGAQGSQVFVYIRSPYSLTAPSPLIINLMFATRRCPSNLNYLESRGAFYEYVLSADAPPFSSTGWASSQVPLRLQLQEESGLDVCMVDVGSYLYTDGVQNQPHILSQEASRKRKMSNEPPEPARMPAKRASKHQLQSRVPEGYTSNPYVAGEGSAYTHIPQPNNLDSHVINSPHGSFTSYGRSQSQQSFPDHDLSRQRSQDFSIGPASIQSLMKAQSPSTAVWKSSTSAISQSRPRAESAAARLSRAPSMSSPTVSANPPLIRTSTMQQSPSPAPTPAAASAGGSFNPYAMYPHKAVLKIKGNLDSMADNWTVDEWGVKRRIVQFWRSQSGSTINTNFDSVAPDNRPPNSICISCIWWEERQECFVTSVDTIYLLESLVAVRFTVEEKNRIRRNLEGFRPMTVSKAKSDSEEFFKIIMGFPNPKPRNIEKDVKVFPWKILAHALKKIIGKYSASYSSTAGALPTPRSSVYGLTQSDAGTDHHLTASPPSTSNSTISSAYSTTLTSTTMSPTSHERLAAPVHFPEAPPLQLSVPTLPHAYTVPSLHSQYAPQEIMNAAPGHIPLTGPSARGSWDFGTLFDTNPAGASPGIPQLSHYPTNAPSASAQSANNLDPR